MGTAVSWTSDTPGLCSASRWDWRNQVWIYLVAEATPDGSWDWAAWSSDATCRSLHGVAGGRFSAMAEAEQAAALIRRVRVLAAA